MKLMSRSVLAVVVAGAVGCGGDAETQPLTLVAPGAAWMAVRTSEAPDWRRIDAPVARVESAGVIEAVVVCRGDIGAGWTWLATAGDGGDDETVERTCAEPRGATAIFDVVGEVDAIYAGGEVTYGPTSFTLGLPPGVHDVVAVRKGPDGVTDELMQVIRGVEFTGVGTRVPIDLDTFGQPTSTATVTLNGEQPWFLGYRGFTATGTWFTLGRQGGVRTMPPALRVEGDRELVYAPIQDGRWVELEIDDGPNLLTTDAPVVSATFGAAASAVTVTWPATDRWDVVRLRASRYVDDSIEYPMWDVIAYPDAIDHHTRDGSVTLTLAAPTMDGFEPTWFPDLTQTYRRSATWQRNRPDGSEGYAQGESITP